jgi:thymidylate kinase
MAQTGTAETRLVVLRGNSGSGKSTVATLLRDRIGRGVAWVEQDYIRRILLREHDRPEATNIGLVGHTVRYALDSGYHVILEGILHSGRYGAMLAELTGDHRGTTGHYYFDVPFEETVRRHSFRAQRNDFTAHDMLEWFEPLDLVRSLDQRVVPATCTALETVEMIFEQMGYRESSRVGTAPSAAR